MSVIFSIISTVIGDIIDALNVIFYYYVTIFMSDQYPTGLDLTLGTV